MAFFDLSIPIDDKGSDKNRSKRTKLVVKAMELGYSGIAYDRLVNGVMVDADRCTITPLPLSSLLKAAPALADTVRFHREVLGVPVGGPFRQYTRLTVAVDSMLQAAAINPGNSVLRSYDLIAIRPMSQKIFEHACKQLEVDLISIDFSRKLPFRLNMPLIKAAAERGIFFEIMYSPTISNVHARRQTFAGVKLLVEWTRGRNIIISSAAPSVNELRGPNDVANMSTLFGLSMEHAKAAVSKNCRSVILHGLTRKKCYKAAIQVENCPPDEIIGSDKSWFNVSEVWDPISSGEGDLILKANLFENVAFANKKGPNTSTVMKAHKPTYAKKVSKSSNHNRDVLPPNENKTMAVHTGLVLYGTQQKENEPALDMRVITKPKTDIMTSGVKTCVEESMSRIHKMDVAQASLQCDYDNRLSFSNGGKLSSLSADRDQIMSNSIKDPLLLSDGALADGRSVVAEHKSTTDKGTIRKLPFTNCDADVEPTNSSLGNADPDIYSLLSSDDSKSPREIEADAVCNSCSQVKVLELAMHDKTIMNTIKQASTMASGSDIKMDGVESITNEIHIRDSSIEEIISISDEDDAPTEEEMTTMGGGEPVTVCDDNLQMNIKSKTVMDMQHSCHLFRRNFLSFSFLQLKLKPSEVNFDIYTVAGRKRKLRRKRLDWIYLLSLRGILKPALFKKKVQSRKKQH